MQLQHPGVVTAVGLEDVDEMGRCIVMEYVDGMTLKEWLRHKPSSQQKRRVVIELCETVGYIHSKGRNQPVDQPIADGGKDPPLQTVADHYPIAFAVQLQDFGIDCKQFRQHD